MTLCAVCPKEWRTVSNGIDRRYETISRGNRVLEKFDCQWFLDFYDDPELIAVHDFETTPAISTYLYAVCAGPYTLFEDFDPMYVP